MYMSQDVALKCRVRLATPWQSKFGQITSSTMFLLGLCYFKKYFLSCGIEPLHEQSLPRWSLILSTNLPAGRLSVCLQTRIYWTLLWNGWVIILSCIFSCISFYSLLVILLINCSIKIKYYYNISRAQSHLILRELLWHASLVLSITRYTHTEYESIRSVNRVDRRPPEIYTWNRQWPLMKQKLGEIICADASTFCLWHSDCDPYFLVRS